jgi:hypothetical protein
MGVNHTVKQTHSDGKEMADVVYWCGRLGSRYDWRFADAQHVALSAGGSQQPCKNCIKAIIKQLEIELK